MDGETLRQAIDSALKSEPFRISGAAIGSADVTALLTREFGTDALVIAGAARASPDGPVTGTLGAPWLGIASGLDVAATFSVVAGVAQLTARIAGFAPDWSLSKAFASLQQSLFDSVTYAESAFTLESLGAEPLPAGFPTGFGLPAYSAAYTAALPPTLGFSATLAPGGALAWAVPFLGADWAASGPITSAANGPSIALTTPTGSPLAIGAFSLSFSGALAAAAPPPPDGDGSSDADDPPTDGPIPLDVLQLAATLSSGSLHIPVFIRTLSPDAAIVSVAGELDDLPALTLAEVGALIGADVSGQVAPDFPALSDIGLNSVALAVKPSTLEIVTASATIGLRQKPTWSLFDGLIIFSDLSVTFTWLPSTRGFSTSVDATATFSGGTLAAGITMPDGSFACDLQSRSIDISKVVKDVSAGTISIGSVTCTALQLTGSVAESYYRFNATVTEDWSFTPPGSTQPFALASVVLDLSYAPAAPVPLSGGVLGNFTIGGATVLAAAGRDAATGAWIFNGSTAAGATIGVHDLVADAAKFLGLPAPDHTPAVTLQNLNMSFNSQTSEFEFAGLAETTIAGVVCDLGVQLSRTGRATLFNGYLWIGDEAFELDFATGTSTVLAGSWTGQSAGDVLDLRKMLTSLGLDLDLLPDAVDLTLNSAEILYDTAGTLILNGDSQAYGDFVFVSTTAADSTTIWGIAAQAKGSVNLSDLPVVGADLAKIATLQMGGLQISASGSALGTAAAALNAALQNEAYQPFYPKGLNYPTFPAVDKTFGAKAIFSGSLDYGSGSLPFQLPLGGSEAQTQAAAPAPPAATPAAPSPAGAPVQVTAASDGTIWYNLQKSFGPVSIQRLGLRYEKADQRLWFELDAALTFGPLSISLLGLGIGSPISDFSVHFALQGLGVAYSQPPLKISGSLVNLNPPGATGVAFEGSLVIETASFSAEAIGYYGDPGGAGFTSLFIFLSSTLSVGGPPSFTVTGLAGGFGYNSNLVLPGIDELAGFPFLALLPNAPAPDPNVLGGSSSPQQALTNLTTGAQPLISADKGQVWVAAGLTFTSFELIHGAAMLIVEAGDELEIALLGSASAQFPQKDAPGSHGIYAQIVLDLELRFLPRRGVFAIDAVLTKGSFLLDPNCVLQGGFAFHVWYGPSDYAGDFVLSLGGYHSAFQAPPWYPTVPRIGFHWPLDDSITVQGGVYLAITPSVMMAGGALDVTFQSGNLRAWLSAHCDVIIRWKPFWVYADIGISIGASYKIDLLFTSVTLSVELGCELELWGPPTAGKVTVDWYIISFTIHFGADTSEQPPAALWSDVDAVLPKPAGSALSLQVTAGLVSDRSAPVPGASTADPPGGEPAPLVARAAAFAFTTRSPIPASSATAGDGNSFSGDKFCVHPLGWTGVDAAHKVTFTDDAGADLSSAFHVKGVYGAVPAGLWGSPPEASEPQVPSGTAATVANQLTGLSFTIHPPATGATGGPIDAAQDLDHTPLDLGGARLPITIGAASAGDVPAASQTSILAIADPATGIGADATGLARSAIFDALAALGAAPPANDPMKPFADSVGCQLAAEPLIVS